MKVFYDFEFVENGPEIPIQPISGGFVAEDGRELYVINQESLTKLMRHPWTSLNVAPSLPVANDQSGVGHFIVQWDVEHPDYQYVMAMDSLVQRVHEFLKDTSDLQLWGYYSAYDHVVLCQLFGSMADLPPGIPMFTHDLQQVIEEYDGAVKLPPTPAGHHALWDARWNRDVFTALMEAR